MKALSPRQKVYRQRLVAQSNQRQATGFACQDLSKLTVPLTLYMTALDDMNQWRRRALEAESRQFGSSDILGEDRLPSLKRQNGNNDNS